MSAFHGKITEITRSRGEHMFPAEDWRYEVDNGDTTAGLGDWRDSQIEQYADDVEYRIVRLIHLAPRAFGTDGDQDAFNKAVVDFFDASRLDDCESEAARRALSFLGEDDPEARYGARDAVYPEDLVNDIERLCHLGMVAYEGRAEEQTIREHIVAMAERHGIEGDDVALSRRFLGHEDGPEV